MSITRQLWTSFYQFPTAKAINCRQTASSMFPMNRLQSNFNTFIESICTQCGCKEAVAPLQEGFSALCEADTGDTRNGSTEIPASFCPTTGAQAKVDAKLRQIGIVVDWSTYTPSRNRSWASQGMPSGTASAYTVSEAEEAGSYTTYNRRTICFYVPVSELARKPVEMYDVNDRMGSDYREIGVDTKFVPPNELAERLQEYGGREKTKQAPGDNALQEGIYSLTEGMTPGNLELAKYFRGLDPSGDEYSDADEDVFEEHRPHFDRWVVHSSDNAQEIYGQGFQYGADTGNLAYTDRHSKGKYAFATPIENAVPPMIPTSGQGITARLPYCNTIDLGGSIVFRTSGVTAYHRDDRENEVVFDRESPEGCFWIRNIHYNAWKTDTVDDFRDHLPVDAYEVIGENPGRPLCKGTYRRCIRWCRDNGDAYSHMMKRWK